MSGLIRQNWYPAFFGRIEISRILFRPPSLKSGHRGRPNGRGPGGLGSAMARPARRIMRAPIPRAPRAAMASRTLRAWCEKCPQAVHC
jgi:hypothetical protein